MGCDGPSAPGTAARPAGCAHHVKVMEHKAQHVATAQRCSPLLSLLTLLLPRFVHAAVLLSAPPGTQPGGGELPGIRRSSDTAAQRIRCAALSAASPLTRGDFGFLTDCGPAGSRGVDGTRPTPQPWLPGRPNGRGGAGQNGARILKARRICPSMGSEYSSVV